MAARDDLSDRIPADAGVIDPRDRGGESSDEARNIARSLEDDRTCGSDSETGEFALPRMTLYCAMRPHTTYTCGVYVFAWVFLPFGLGLAFYSYVLIWGRPFVLFMRQNRQKWMAVDGGWADAPPLVQELAFWLLLLSKETKVTAHACIQGRRMTGLSGLIKVLGTARTPRPEPYPRIHPMLFVVSATLVEPRHLSRERVHTPPHVPWC